MPSFHGNYRFSLSNSQIGLGLYFGFCTFQAEGTLAASRSRLIPMGLDVSYFTVSDSPFTLHGRLTGGPALLSLSTDGEVWQTKTLPFVIVGIGFHFRITQLIGLSLDNGFSLFFERESPIMGYSPSLSVSVTF